MSDITASLGRLARPLLTPDRVQRLKRIVIPIRLALNYRYDRRRFVDGSSAARGRREQEHFRAQIAFDYHRIEKGLTLPAPRQGFGLEAVRRLIGDTREYRRRYGEDDLTATVRAVLRAYLASGLGAEALAGELDTFLAEGRADDGPDHASGGALRLDRESLFPVAPEQAGRFLRSRRSVRHSTGEPVSSELVAEAVSLAQCAPSVCNRQSGRVYVANTPERIARVLKHQNGNGGFGHTLGAVFVVAADLKAFRNTGERNQPFVDGGIFAMSLVSGLHALGLGSCMLNWSQEVEADRALRRELGIPDGHVVITMVGAGHVPDQPIRVCASPRIPQDRVITWLS